MSPLVTFLLKAALLLGTYALATWPAGKVVGLLMRRWATPNFPLDEGTRRLGRHIGYVERIIMVTLILGNHYDALSLLLAAKSILRVSDKKVRQQTEYILLGTLLSTAAAILLALLARLLYGYLGFAM